MQNWFLQDIKEQLQHHQTSKSYRMDYNTKIRSTKENIAKIMGIDPDHFSDLHLKLSLLYLLPSDIERRKYKPNIPAEIPVQAFLDIISQYNSSEHKESGTRSSDFKSFRREISLVHSIVLDAMEQINISPGLELFIDPDEVVFTEVPSADTANAAPSSEEHVDNLVDNSSISKVADYEGELVNELADVSITDDVETAGLAEKSGEDISFTPSDDDVVSALLMFPFKPLNVENGSKVEKKTLQLQFNRLNHLIQDRPDLINMYYPAIKHILHSQQKRKNGPISARKKSGDGASLPVFRGKVNRSFVFNSVVTTAVPGSGKITINNKPFLDFFPEILSRMIVISPLRVSRTLGVFDINVEVEQDNPDKVHSLAHCIAMSIADCLQMYSPHLRGVLKGVYKNEMRVEYNKAYKKNSRKRYKWRKR